MRHIPLLLGFLLLAAPVQGQSFVIEDSRPQPGEAGVSLSSEIAFAFSEEISVSTDWNTAFVYEPRDSLGYSQVSLCLNFDGSCGGGDDVPRFVRFEAEHRPDTDYTWMIYAVQTPGGAFMDEPYVLRYTTASTIGQQSMSGEVRTPAAKAVAWTPQVRTSLRTLALGLERTGRGRLFFDREDMETTRSPDETTVTEQQSLTSDEERPHTRFGAIGSKSHSGGHTQILLLDAFSDRESAWSVRAADVIQGASGKYSVAYLRDGTYWPVAVRYADGTNAEIEALGFHDPDGDGEPDPVTVDGSSPTGIDVPLYEFPLTTARAQRNLSVAIDSAAAYAGDQELKTVQGDDGLRPAGTAYQWTYRFYSPNEELETRVTVDPIDVTVDTASAPSSFMTEMTTVPGGFIDSDEALQIALDDGGQAFIDPYHPRNITTILQGGNLYWTDTPVTTTEFWRIRLVVATSTQVESFDRYVDMETGDILDPSDNPEVPAPPADFVATAGDGEIALTWTANSEEDVSGYNLYRSTSPSPEISSDALVHDVDALIENTNFTDTDVSNGQVYYYRLTAVDVDGNESTPTREVSAFPYPSSLEIEITRSFGDPDQQRSYRLVALPGDDDVTVESTLAGSADEDWTVYWDDGSEQNFLKKYDGSSTFSFRAGRGFWMLSTNTWSPSGTAETASLAADGTYSIDLHDGWNIISNPFDRDVAWSAVQSANSVTQALWRWDGSFTEDATFASASSGEAFYFLNEAGLDHLKIPYPGAPDSSPADAALQATHSVLALTAYQKGERMSAIRVGVAANASDGRDAYEQFAPPAYFKGATLRLINEQIDERYTELAAEFRAIGREGHTFDLTLRVEPGQTVEVRASGLDQFDGQKVALVDPTVGRSHDLHTDSSVQLRPETEAMSLTLLVGSAAFVDAAEKEVLPTTLQLLPNYPNPFHSQTTLEFALPERKPVRLVIYDILGRQVRTLVDRSFQAGLHPVRWDGKNDAGRPVASGLYLGRLEVGARTRFQRLVLVR